MTFTADLGQGEDSRASAREKAKLMGIKEIYVEDLREEFVRDFCLPDVPRQRAMYEGDVPAGHLDRPAADRQAPDRDRPRRRAPTRCHTGPPARATTRSGSS